MSDGTSRRLFVAIFPPAPALEHLGRAVDDLAVSRTVAAARLTARDSWHVTLAFLGPTPADRIGDVTAALATAASSAGPRMRLRIAGSGTFGRGDRQILWVGLDGDVAALGRLAEVTGRELTERGLAPKGRHFEPHLTISRPGADLPAELVAADTRRLATYSGPLWTPATLDLVASDTVPTDAGTRSRYTPLASAPLS